MKHLDASDFGFWAGWGEYPPALGMRKPLGLGGEFI